MGTDAQRLEWALRVNLELVWRLLRRAGLCPADAEDVSQEACIVLARRLAEVESDRERSSLTGTALRMASDRKRSLRRRPAGDSALELPSLERGPDELAELRGARLQLDELLAPLPDEQREVFLLVELEERLLRAGRSERAPRSPQVQPRDSTTRPELRHEKPTAFAPTNTCESPYITASEISRNLPGSPTNSSEEAEIGGIAALAL